jgi:hypothetical protein
MADSDGAWQGALADVIGMQPIQLCFAGTFGASFWPSCVIVDASWQFSAICGASPMRNGPVRTGIAAAGIASAIKNNVRMKLRSIGKSYSGIKHASHHELVSEPPDRI